MATNKLKIKISSQRIETASVTRSCEVEQQFSLVNKCGCGSRGDVNSHPKQNSTVPGSNKRGASWVVESQRVKRQKMDRAVTQQCSALVKDLIKHKFGWGFSQPVDPVKLNLPDYFSIISHPMDLGTIKSKLEKSHYADTKEIAADIRLTFSNAMLYNPLTNDFHIMAKHLNDYFETRWKTLEQKWNRQKSKFSSGQTKEVVVREHCPKTPPLRTTALPKKSKPSEERVMKNSLDIGALNVKLPKSVENSARKSLEQNSPKGTGKKAGCSVNAKSSFRSIAGKSTTCGRTGSDSTHESSGVSFDGSAGRDHHACSTDTSKMDFQAKGMLALQSDPDSDGAVSALDDGNMCHTSHHTSPATDATSGEGWMAPLDVQLSPTKALRAAMLKKRFADMILKAQHKTLLDHNGKADPVKMRQEKERLEKRQREEKARIEGQLRAAEAATRRKEENQLKKQREREREAARIALEKMGKTVEFEENLQIIKELEMLSGCYLSYNFHVYSKRPEAVKGYVKGARYRSPLERLGLFMKDDDKEVAINADGVEEIL